MSVPKVSVVIPARDAAAFVGAAVGSVLGQTWHDLECIVVDDGSSDDTRDIVRSFDDRRVRLVPQAAAGVAAARNRGIDLASGDFVAFLDADDVWLPDKLARQLAVARTSDGAGVVLCGYTITDEALNPLVVVRPRQRELDMRRWLFGEGNGLLISSTGLVARDVIERVGRFETMLSTSADLDFAFRLARSSRVAAASDSLVLYRSHPSQMHRDLDVFERDATAVIRTHLADDQRSLDRALANLHSRLLVYRLLQRDLHDAARHGRTAWRHQPSRLFLLPAGAGLRKLRRLIDRPGRRAAG